MKRYVSDELRQIGWDLWDPIGLSHKYMDWQGRPFEDEYDCYTAKAAEMLTDECGVEEVVEYLFHVESVLMGISPKEINDQIHTKLVKVVSAIHGSLESVRRGRMIENSQRKFWNIDRNDEGAVVTRLMRRRFGSVIDDLNRALDEADPYDLFHPGNPDEYADVARELLVILDGRINVDRAVLTDCVEMSCARCFPESDLERDLDEIVDRIAQVLPAGMGGKD